MGNDLRLAAVVDDKFSAPLKLLQQQLTQVGGREHATRIKEQSDAFKRAHEEVAKFGAQLKGVLAPALDSAGLSMLGIGAGLGGMVVGLNNVSASLNTLRRLSASIRLSPQNILNDQALMAKWGMSADDSNAAIDRLAKNMQALSYRQGDFYKALVTEGGAAGQAEAERLLALKGNLQAQFDEVVRFSNRIKSPIVRGYYDTVAFGNEAVAHAGDVSSAILEKQIADSEKGSEKVTAAALDAAAKYEDAVNKFDHRMATLKNRIGGAVLPAATALIPSDEDGGPSWAKALAGTVGLAAELKNGVGAVEGGIGSGWNSLEQRAKKWWNGGAAPSANAFIGPRALGLLPPDAAESERERARAQALSNLRVMAAPNRADLPVAGGFENSLEAPANDPSGFFIPGGDSTSKEKQTGLQKSIQSTAILLSLRDVTIDAERRIAEWWKKGITEGVNGALNPDTPASQAAAASLESVSNPGGYRSVYGPAGGAPPPSNNPAVRPPGGGGLTGAGAAGYRQVYEAAKAAGDPHPEVTAAQWANESGWGAHPSGKNNFFGQTAPGGGFFDYPTPEAGLADHLKRWTNFPDYRSAKTPEEALQAKIRHGYNQNAEYPGRIMAAMKLGEQYRNSVSAFAAPSGPGSLAPTDTQIVGGANLMSSGEFERKTGIHPTVGGDLVQVKTAGGHTFTVNKYGAANFKAFVEDLEGRGYKFNGDPQGYNPRSKFDGGGPSEHAYGNAIDINPGANPFTHNVNRPLQTDLPPDVSAIAAKYGLSWGGDWHSVKDAMHFEYRGSPWIPNTATAAAPGRVRTPTEAADRAIAPKTSAVDRAIGAQSFLQGGGMGAHHGVVNINLRGNLRDVNATTKVAGTLFKQVHLNRGATMPSAEG
jgi:hypothetical protein